MAAIQPKEAPLPPPSTLLPMLKTLRASVSQTNAALAPLLSSLKTDPASFDLSAGLSLLALRPNLLLSYTHLYALLIADRLTSASSSATVETSSSYSSTSVLDSFASAREERTGPLGEKTLANEMVLVREVMERVRGMEGKVAKQVDRLVKGALEAGQPKNPENDPLSFRPNPAALLKPSRPGARSDEDESDSEDDAVAGPSSKKAGSSGDGIYRPPRLAAVPYTESSKRSKSDAARPPKTSSLLTDYALSSSSSLPHQQSATGLNVPGSSGRQKEKSLAQRQTEFEESAFTRLPLKKTDLKRREREERDDALGLGGWSDVLGGLNGAGAYEVGGGDGSKGGAWDRRKRAGGDDERGESYAGAKTAKKGRFERDLSKRGKTKKRR